MNDYRVEIDHYSHLEGVREVLEVRENMILRAMQTAAPSNKKILDLGCGDGCFLVNATRQFPGLMPVGLDLSPGQLEKARTRIPQGKFLQGSLGTKLPFADQEFDFVYSAEVIEHLFDTDLFLKEAYRVLKPGGYLYMTTPNLFAWYNRFLMLFGISPLYVEYSTTNASIGYGILRKFKATDQPVGHLRIFHPLAFKELQMMHGFSSVRLRAAPFQFFPKLIRVFDRLVATVWHNGGSILVSESRKS